MIQDFLLNSLQPFSVPAASERFWIGQKARTRSLEIKIHKTNERFLRSFVWELRHESDNNLSKRKFVGESKRHPHKFSEIAIC